MTREDVQHISDMRLIALAKLKMWDGDPCFSASIRAMKEVVGLLEAMIAAGPPEMHFIIEQVSSLPQIQRDLRQSVFGRLSAAAFERMS